MGSPITWRNVDAPDLTGVSRMMGVATDTINGGFDQISGLVDSEAKRQKDNWQNQKNNNTQAFMNEISKFRTPEELAAAQSSGVLDQLRQQYQAQVDQGAIRSAEDARLGILQNRVLEGNKFTNSVADNAAKPFKEQAAALYAAGNKTGGDAILAAHPEITDTAALVKAGQEGVVAKDSRNVADALRPQLVPQALAQQKHAIVASDLAARNDTEAILTNKLNDRLATESANYNQQQQDIGKQMGKIAFAQGLPIDKSGIPKFQDMTPEQTVEYNKALFIKKLPSVEQYTTGDTAAADALHTNIAASGEFPKAFIEKNKAAIRGALDSTKNNGSVGNSAEVRATANARNEAEINALAKTTWSLPGTPNAVRNQDDIRSIIKDQVEPDKQVSANNAIQSMLRTGIELKDGSKAVPSMEDIKAALGSTNDGWGLDGWGGGGITGDFGVKLINNLKKLMNSSDFTKQRENMAKVDAFNLRRDAANIYSRPTVVTPFSNNK